MRHGGLYRTIEAMGLHRRAALRHGFFVMIGLQVLATILAYFVQESFSKRSVEIYRQFAAEQQVLTTLRRTLWMGGIVARDFFLNKSPNREEEFRGQLEALKLDSERLIPKLRDNPATSASVNELEKHFQELWATLRGRIGPEGTTSEPYEFIQREIVPRRDAASVILRQLGAANIQTLRESERLFTSSRSTAAQSLMYLLGTCVLAGIFVAYTSLRYSRMLEGESSERFREVSEAKLQLERLSARLMQIQEEERTRLSRELHDEIVQNLAVVKLELTRAVSLPDAMSPDLAERLAGARNLAESTMRSVRDISTLLRPPLLDDLGLGPALQAQSQDFSKRTGITCMLFERGVSDSLPEQVKTCVYRVVQEALRNCEKHSGATEVFVTVMQTADEIIAEVRDNGRGFDAHQEQDWSFPRLGLLGMRERASRLQGYLDLESGEQSGTVVRLRLPLEPIKIVDTERAFV